MNSKGTTTDPVRVLVVDDSAFMRFTISKHLNDSAGILVVGTAHDGNEALELIPKFSPDVITLDVEMPHLDGLSTLREIMARFPTPVIMLSSLTTEGAVETVQALTLGAVDFVGKPTYKANMASILEEVTAKVLRAAKAKVWPITRPPRLDPVLQPPVNRKKQIRPLMKTDRVVVIGTSTGGPRALNTIIPKISSSINAAFLIIQHMPVGFTRSLAERLDNSSSLYIKEAEPGDTLEVGKGLLAQGGFHMVLDNQGIITLNQNPAVHGVRPAVDVTMLSAAKLYGNRIVAVIMTGMGSDGTNGTILVHSSGGYVIAEAEETCVVWGMPRSAVEAGSVDEITPLHKIPDAIARAVSR